MERSQYFLEFDGVVGLLCYGVSLSIIILNNDIDDIDNDDDNDNEKIMSQ